MTLSAERANELLKDLHLLIYNFVKENADKKITTKMWLAVLEEHINKIDDEDERSEMKQSGIGAFVAMQAMSQVADERNKKEN